MKTIRILLTTTIGMVCLCSARAALDLNWQNGTIQGGSPASVPADSAPIAFQRAGVSSGALQALAATPIQLSVASREAAPRLAGSGFSALSPEIQSVMAGRGAGAGNAGNFTGAGGGYAISLARVAGGASSAAIAFPASGLSAKDSSGSFAAVGDIQFNGAMVAPVPEPVTCALILFGAAFAGMGAVRFYRGRRRDAAAS